MRKERTRCLEHDARAPVTSEQIRVAKRDAKVPALTCATLHVVRKPAPRAENTVACPRQTVQITQIRLEMGNGLKKTDIKFASGASRDIHSQYSPRDTGGYQTF